MENRSRVSRSPSIEEIRFKLKRIVRCHEESKTAFQQLKSQIKIGLLEAEDVFASLSIPLMRLVGLKTEEMAGEGRSSSILINTSFPPEDGCSSYSSRAVRARRELEEKQHLQLQKLVFLLRKIENVVNSRHAAILQSLDDHRLSLHRLSQKATSFLSRLCPPDQPADPKLALTFKLLWATFEHVGLTLSSVEADVEAMVRELAENMCEPMARHVRSLREEMEGGAVRRVMGVVEEMEWAVRERGEEAEAARKRARAAEEGKAEAVRRLQEFEEKVRSMKEFVGRFVEAKRRGMVEPSIATHKLLAMEKDQSSDEKLQRDVLRHRKRRAQEATSPVAPTNLQTSPNRTRVGSYCNHYIHGDQIQTSTIDRPIPRKDDGPLSPRSVMVSPRMMTRAYARRLAHDDGPSLPKLGPSPSSGSHKRGRSSIWSNTGMLRNE